MLNTSIHLQLSVFSEKISIFFSFMFFSVVRVISLCGSCELPSDFETVHYLGRFRVNDVRFVFSMFLEVVAVF